MTSKTNFWEGKLHKYPLNDPHTKLDLSDLIGSTIVDIGFHHAQAEGGLSIDYKKDEKNKRVVFGFNELGIWVTWQG
mgnify:FL=1